MWMELSHSLVAQSNNPDYFNSLKKIADYFDFFLDQIQLDIQRTFNEKDKKRIEIMEQILKIYARRNPFVGYCQGLNFVVWYIVYKQFDGEEGFWLLTQLIEVILPLDYYTSMIGLIIDQKIFKDILSQMVIICINIFESFVKQFQNNNQKIPSVLQHFQNLGMDPTLFTVQWFIALYTQTLQLSLCDVVWDNLLAFGSVVLFKTAILLFKYLENDILETTSFENLYIVKFIIIYYFILLTPIKLMQEKPKTIQITNQEFQEKMNKIYINKTLLKVQRMCYRNHKDIKQQIQYQPSKINLKAFQNCNEQNYICKKVLENNKINNQFYDCFVFRPKKEIKIKNDFLKNFSNEKSETKESDQIQSFNEKLLMGRHHHICQSQIGDKISIIELSEQNQGSDQKLVFSEDYHKLNSLEIIDDNMKKSYYKMQTYSDSQFFNHMSFIPQTFKSLILDKQ